MVGSGNKTANAESSNEPSVSSKDGSLMAMGRPASVETVTSNFQKGAALENERRHLFWETQPVGNYQDGLGEGPIEPAQPVSEVRQEPYNLPSTYEWSTCDLKDEQTIKEVYTLLTNNYVEDDDNMFRFDYSVAFLRWALTPPGYFPSWHIGVRAKSSKKLVAFITGIPARIRSHETVVPMAEINFLCVHKKLRSKRLAPVLIKEVTRRVHLENMWQAAYTAGVVLPTPIATCQYWHRPLNPKKLIEVGFSRLAPRMTMSRTIKLYRLPEEATTPGFRPMERRDVVAVTKLLQTYLAQFQVAPHFSEDDVEYLLLPIDNVINSFVVENSETHEITDFGSFYALPSTIIGNQNYSLLKAAYSYYNVATSIPLLQLMNDVLVMAKQRDYDVFNALDVMHNETFLKELKFGPGDGQLHYYLYNYRLRAPLKPTEMGGSLEPIFQNYMYVGFTGSNGVFCNQTHTIYSWSFSTSRPPSSKPKSPEAPALHTSYDCYKFDGCNNYRALIIGVPVAVGGCALIFLMICIYCVYCRKTQKNPEYKAVDVSGPNSGPQTGGDNAVKVNAKSASAHELPAPLVNIALPLCHGKDKDPQDPKPTDFAPVAGQPSVTASSISMEPKPEVPVVESVDRNPHGKVTMCCVQTKPKRDYKDTIVFSAKELAQATKNFSEKVIIGTPGRKPVYKGVLRDNGAEVAIKEIALNNISNEFVSKAMLLGRIRHPNLVHLLGWCKCEEKRKLYLVYDYMPRGSMDKLLLLSKDADGFLGFDARYNVLVGVAAGLNCLHAEWEQCVLHRDVKPSNVYLDAMFNAHVGNFSLASLVDHDKVAHSTVMDGTLGYMAPEIPFTGKPTMKSDVFSYGILVLEVACGRLPLDWHLPQEERVLLDCVWRAREEGDIARVADKRLENTYSEKQMATLLQIGLNCAHPDPSMRPNMAFVWKVLIGGAEPPELPAKKPVIENYAALSSLGTMRNSASRGNLGSTSSDTQ